MDKHIVLCISILGSELQELHVLCLCATANSGVNIHSYRDKHQIVEFLIQYMVR